MLGARKWTVSLPCMLLVAVVLAVVPRPGMAQVLYGSILGDLKDSTGASLPGANIVITNKGTGLTRETVSDTTGHFNFPDLPAGTYGMKVSQQGFKSFEQTVGHGQPKQRHSCRRHARSWQHWRDRHRQCRATEAADRQRRGARKSGSEGAGECAGAAGPQLPADVPHAARVRAPDQLALHPEQSVAIARVHGQRDKRRPEQHAHRRRQHRQRPAAARLLVRADARGDRRGQRRYEQHERRAGTGRRSRDQRADQERQQCLPRIRIRVLHQPGHEGLADAVR